MLNQAVAEVERALRTEGGEKGDIGQQEGLYPVAAEVVGKSGPKERRTDLGKV